MAERMASRVGVVVATACALAIGCVNRTETRIEPTAPRLVRKHEQPLGGAPTQMVRLRLVDDQVDIIVSWASSCVRHTVITQPQKRVRERSVSTAGVLLSLSLLSLGAYILIDDKGQGGGGGKGAGQQDVPAPPVGFVGGMLLIAGGIVGGVALARTGTEEVHLPPEVTGRREAASCPYAPMAHREVVVRVGRRSRTVVTDAEGKARVPLGAEGAMWVVELDGVPIRDLEWE